MIMKKIVIFIATFLFSCGQNDPENGNASKCIPESCEESGCHEVKVSYIEEEPCLNNKTICVEEIYYNVSQGLEASSYYIYEDRAGECWASISVKYPSSFTAVTSQDNENCGKYIGLSPRECRFDKTTP